MADKPGMLSGIFMPFNQHSRTVLALAQEEAVQLNRPSIGTEHRRLGLMRKEKSEALASMGVNSTVGEIRKLRMEARQIGDQVRSSAANNGAEEGNEKKAPNTNTEDNGESDIKEVKDPEEPEDLDDLGKLDEPPTP